jgi:hypothetical protein
LSPADLVIDHLQVDLFGSAFAFDQRRNGVRAQRERYALLRWATCVQSIPRCASRYGHLPPGEP